MFKALLSLVASSFSRKPVSIYTSISTPQPPPLMSRTKNNSIQCYSGNLLNVWKQIPESEKHKMAGRNMFVLKVPRRQLEKYIPRTCV